MNIFQDGKSKEEVQNLGCPRSWTLFHSFYLQESVEKKWCQEWKSMVQTIWSKELRHIWVC